MGLLTLLFDVGAKTFVNALTNPGPFQLPDLHQEDTLDIDVQLVKRIQWASPPYYAFLDISNYSLYVGIGSANNVLASTNVFNKSGDNTTFSGQLALNTAGINALADGVSSIFELRITGTGYYRLQTPVTIRKSVALAAALVTVAADTALGALEASQLYMPYSLPAGRGITLTSLDGTKKALLYLDNDGTLRWPLLT